MCTSKQALAWKTVFQLLFTVLLAVTSPVPRPGRALEKRRTRYSFVSAQHWPNPGGQRAGADSDAPARLGASGLPSPTVSGGLECPALREASMHLQAAWALLRTHSAGLSQQTSRAGRDLANICYRPHVAAVPKANNKPLLQPKLARYKHGDGTARSALLSVA